MPQTSVSLDWAEAAEMDPVHIGQALTQVGNPGSDGVPDGIYVTLGNVPPVIVPPGSTPQQTAENLRGTAVPVRVSGRFHMNRAMVDKLIHNLQRAAEQYDTLTSRVTAQQKVDQ
jgi:hypothetical protein